MGGGRCSLLTSALESAAACDTVRASDTCGAAQGQCRRWSVAPHSSASSERCLARDAASRERERERCADTARWRSRGHLMCVARARAGLQRCAHALCARYTGSLLSSCRACRMHWAFIGSPFVFLCDRQGVSRLQIGSFLQSAWANPTSVANAACCPPTDHACRRPTRRDGRAAARAARGTCSHCTHNAR
jgi:hypothetical protein